MSSLFIVTKMVVCYWLIDIYRSITCLSHDHYVVVRVRTLRPDNIAKWPDSVAKCHLRQIQVSLTGSEFLISILLICNSIVFTVF